MFKKLEQALETMQCEIDYLHTMNIALLNALNMEKEDTTSGEIKIVKIK